MDEYTHLMRDYLCKNPTAINWGYYVMSEDDLSQVLGQFTRNYTQTVKRAADNKRRYAPGEGSIPPFVVRGFQRGAPFGTRLCLQSVVCYTCWRG